MKYIRPIIVEGPDGSGKTTLLERLSKDLGLPVHHTGGPITTMDQLREKLAKMRACKTTHLIDRCPHISNPIYESFTGNPPIMDAAVLHSLLGYEFSPVVVFCRLTLSADMFDAMVLARKDHKPSHHVDLVRTNYFDIVMAYDELHSTQMAGVLPLKYNWKSDSYDKLLETLKCAAFS